jgi:excisionase family DNA binding protein
MQDGTEYLTPVQVAEMLQLHPRTVIRLIRKGRLPAINAGVGKHAEYRINRTDLEGLRFRPLPRQPHVSCSRPRRGKFVPLLRLG